MTSRQSKSHTGLLGDEISLDSRHGSISPIGGAMKNSVREIEMKELRSMTSAKSNKSNDKHDKHDNDVRESSVDNDSGNEEYDHYEMPRQITVISNNSDRHDNGDISNYNHSRDSLANSDKNQAMIGPPFQTHSEPRSSQSSHSGLSSELDISLPPESRMSCTSGATDLSESGDGDELDYYCVDHMKLISYKLARSEHADCEFLVPAHEWAEAQTMERDRRNVEEQLKRFYDFAGRMITERTDFKRHLQEEKELVTDAFLDVMEDLIAYLLTKQKQFMSQLSQLHDKHMSSINEQVKRCKKVQNETSTSLKKLSDCQPGTSEFRALKKTIQDKCPIYEEILRRDFNNATRIDYEFRQDAWVERIFDDFNSIGDVIAHPRPSKLPGFLSASAEIDYAKKDLKQVVHNDGTSELDDNSSCFSGATFIQGGRIILTDWNNSCLKMINTKGVLVQRMALPNNPWDVKQLSDNRVVVTVPGEQKVYTVVFESSPGVGMNIESSFDTDCECWGIVAVQDKLAMTCDPWSKTPSVKLYNLSGKLLAFYQKDNKGGQLFAYPEHIATDINQKVLYVSDSRNNIVIALTLEGCVLFRYCHKLLEYPAGVTTDNQGYIYVCGKDSHNVHQITKTGDLVRVLLDAATVQSPRAIYFEADGECIVITDVSSESCDDFITCHWK